MNKYILVMILTFPAMLVFGQSPQHNFRIRTITAGITISGLEDTASIINAVKFLKEASTIYINAGYEVQTIRIATQNLYEFLGNKTYEEALPFLKQFDKIAGLESMPFAIGHLLPPDEYDPKIVEWSTKLVNETRMISFSIPISSAQKGIHANSIKAAAEIIVAISKNSPGGEGNFRFTASANTPAGIPFFPAAYHHGPNSFAIGLESPNLLKEVFTNSNWSDAGQNLKFAMESSFKPLQGMAVQIAQSTGWAYDGIDTSPAPGLDASIGEAIETLTGQPFGGPSTLRTCALITDVLKNLELKTCGYSGLMLPVIEDKILAKRAQEGRFSVQELLLFSSVSGTGLDVVPLPGDTSPETITRVLSDVAALSLKYNDKALSARLFLIPNKKAGDIVVFDNPFLTSTAIMKIE